MARNNHGKNPLLDHERNANDKFFLFSSRTRKRPRRMELSWPRQRQRRAKFRPHLAAEVKAMARFVSSCLHCVRVDRGTSVIVMGWSGTRLLGIAINPL